jgi:hypothetical protein
MTVAMHTPLNSRHNWKSSNIEGSHKGSNEQTWVTFQQLLVQAQLITKKKQNVEETFYLIFVHPKNSTDNFQRLRKNNQKHRLHWMDKYTYWSNPDSFGVQNIIKQLEFQKINKIYTVQLWVLANRRERAWMQ